MDICETATRMNSQENIYSSKGELRLPALRRRMQGLREAARSLGLGDVLAAVARIEKKLQRTKVGQKEVAKNRRILLRVIRPCACAVRTVPHKREATTGGPSSSAGPGDNEADDPDQPPQPSGAVSPFENSPFTKLKFTDSRGALSARRAFAVVEILALLVAGWTR